MSESKTDRQQRIPGFDQNCLGNANILVIGAGGTGNELIEKAAMLGVGNLTIVDYGRVKQSGLAKNCLFSEDDIDKPKAPAAAAGFERLSTVGGKADAIYGDAITDIGDGVYERADVVALCLDNRMARMHCAGKAKMLCKPHVEMGLSLFNYNTSLFDGDVNTPCYACTINPKDATGASGNSCDVIKSRLRAEKIVPMIVTNAAMSAGESMNHIIKILHHKQHPDENRLPKPLYGSEHFYIDATLESYVKRYDKPNRDCPNHNYSFGNKVIKTNLSASDRLGPVLQYVANKYGGEYVLSLDKDANFNDRAGFITKAFCKGCGTKKLELYKPLKDISAESLLCEECARKGKLPMLLSEASPTIFFHAGMPRKILSMTLAELGIPPLHVLCFQDASEEREPLFIELSADEEKVLPKYHALHSL